MEGEEAQVNSPGDGRRGAVLVALEVAGAKALDGDELRQWLAMTDRVMERPGSLSALTEAAAGEVAPIIPPAAKSMALWGAGAVLIYNFVIRDVIILAFKMENAPPPAITADSVIKLFSGLFGL